MISYAVFCLNDTATTEIYTVRLTLFPYTTLFRSCCRAGDLDHRLMRYGLTDRLQRELLKFDAELKSAGINPGTTADLTVATLFAAALQEILMVARKAQPG